MTPGRILGKLSEQFETSGRGPGTVSTGIGDAGGASYGSYQMTSVPEGGTVGGFVAQPDFPFRAHFAALTPGSAEFTAAWKALAASRRDEFQACQHEFIKRTHFDPLVRKIRKDTGVDVSARSHTLQDVIWSTAVHHGGLTEVPVRALKTVAVGPDDRNFDREFIIAIYAERGRKNASGTLVHFSRNSPQIQKGVAARFVEEQRKALAMLEEELGP
jgi:hypothetical protein